MRWRRFPMPACLALRCSLVSSHACFLPACVRRHLSCLWVLWITKAPPKQSKARKGRAQREAEEWRGSCHPTKQSKKQFTQTDWHNLAFSTLVSLGCSTGSKQQWWRWLPCSPLGLLLSTPVWIWCITLHYLTFPTKCELPYLQVWARYLLTRGDWVSEWVKDSFGSNRATLKLWSSVCMIFSESGESNSGLLALTSSYCPSWVLWWLLLFSFSFYLSSPVAISESSGLCRCMVAQSAIADSACVWHWQLACRYGVATLNWSSRSFCLQV